LTAVLEAAREAHVVVVIAELEELLPRFQQALSESATLAVKPARASVTVERVTTGRRTALKMTLTGSSAARLASVVAEMRANEVRPP
jgi:hypothetical protein